MTTKRKVAREILQIRKPLLLALAGTFPKTPHRVQKTVLAVAIFGKFGTSQSAAGVRKMRRIRG